MLTKYVNIGNLSIEVNDGHIYTQENIPATYDFVLWNIIHRLIDIANLDGIELLDIGANVGDSAAHFRRGSNARAVCIEPSDKFYTLLERNSTALGDVELVKALIVPDGYENKVRYVEREQTGSSEICESKHAWRGAVESPASAAQRLSDRAILKTDTDGFDVVIVQGFLALGRSISDKFPMIVFEGPVGKGYQADGLRNWQRLFKALGERGYGLMLLTNRGIPLFYSGPESDAAFSMLNALAAGHRHGSAFCHYLDIIAIQDSLPNVKTALNDLTQQNVFSPLRAPS